MPNKWTGEPEACAEAAGAASHVPLLALGGANRELSRGARGRAAEALSLPGRSPRGPLLLLPEGPAAWVPSFQPSCLSLCHTVVFLLRPTPFWLMGMVLRPVPSAGGDRLTCHRVPAGHCAVHPSHPGLKRGPGPVGSSGCLKSSPSVSYKPRHEYRVCLFSISF